MDETEKKKKLFEYLKLVDGIFEEVRRFVIGQKSAISRVVLGLLTVGQLTPIAEGEDDSGDGILGGGGHMLLEGAPGLVKTTLLSILAKVCHGTFNRIQCTPDLLPADVVGTEIFYRTAEGGGSSYFNEGPIFANFVLADEINRATPEAHSAFLEAMSSRSVTIPVISKEHKKRILFLPNPFLFAATQNPVEERGVKDLPVAHLDRFAMKIIMANPTIKELESIQELHEHYDELKIKRVITLQQLREVRKFIHREIFVSESARRYIARLSHAFIPFPFSEYEKKRYEEIENDREFFDNWEEIWKADYAISDYQCKLRELISPGSSAARPNIYLRHVAKSLAFCRNKKGFRDYILPEDVKKIARDILRHRILLADKGRIIAKQLGSKEAVVDIILEKVLEKVVMPS